MARIGSRVRIELERGLGGRVRGGELFCVERDRLCSGLEDLPVAGARQRDGGEIEVESPGERTREDGNGLAALGYDEDVAAQVE